MAIGLIEVVVEGNSNIFDFGNHVDLNGHLKLVGGRTFATMQEAKTYINKEIMKEEHEKAVAIYEKFKSDATYEEIYDLDQKLKTGEYLSAKNILAINVEEFFVVKGNPFSNPEDFNISNNIIDKKELSSDEYAIYLENGKSYYVCNKADSSPKLYGFSSKEGLDNWLINKDDTQVEFKFNTPEEVIAWTRSGE